MKTALLVIDVQNDFCPGGALAVKGGDEIVSGINRLLNSNRYALKVASLDWHPREHKSFAENNPGAQVGELGTLSGQPQVMWPVHCVQDTMGADFHPELHRKLFHRVVTKGENPEVDSYSAFFDNNSQRPQTLSERLAAQGIKAMGENYARPFSPDTGLHRILQQHGIEAVEIVGLALDYCVKATALDAANLGYKTTVLVNGTRAVNLKLDDAERAICEMKAAGVVISEEKL